MVFQRITRTKMTDAEVAQKSNCFQCRLVRIGVTLGAARYYQLYAHKLTKHLLNIHNDI